MKFYFFCVVFLFCLIHKILRSSVSPPLICMYVQTINIYTYLESVGHHGVDSFSVGPMLMDEELLDIN